jgi:uncharacterized protein (TIGR03790 family)
MLYKELIIKKLYIIVILTNIISLVPYKPAHALLPTDLVVVYNQNMQDSKDIAQYYCLKRGVPVSNLVGVDIPESENILRPDYESKMIPPIKRLVNNLKLSGNSPAILLVYGIPLRIKETISMNHYKQYEELAESKVREYKRLVQQLGRDLEMLIDTGKVTLPNYERENIESISTPEIIKSVNKTVIKASEYLKSYTPTASNQETYLQTVSLLFRITGVSPIVRDIRNQVNTMDDHEKSIFLRINSLSRYNAILSRQLAELQFFGFTPEKTLEVSTIIRTVNGVIGELLFWDAQQKKEIGEMASASVDSELTLILTADHQLSKWLLNPFLITHDKLPGIEMIRRKTVMVGRLDASSPDMAKRMIDDVLETEKTGLTGTFYIDARGLHGDSKKDSYQQYDEHLRNLYKIVKSKSSLPVVLDDNSKLFPEKSCSDAALYVGWYSLAKYVDSFEWKKGAVGFHIASSEASTLKKKHSQVWCKRLVEEGVAATLGPVNEPYLSAFPLPDLFFPLLMEGKLTLLEVYFKSVPHISWRMILIGDPLYTPFKNNPAINLTAPRLKDEGDS